jgi:hypothetical protein
MSINLSTVLGWYSFRKVSRKQIQLSTFVVPVCLEGSGHSGKAVLCPGAMKRGFNPLITMLWLLRKDTNV